MANSKYEKTFKIKNTMDITKSDISKSKVILDAETKKIIQNFINKKEADAAEEGGTINYFYETVDIEKTAVLENWFKNGTELKLLPGEAESYNCYMYTDGKHKLELPSSCVYLASCIDHDFNVIDFFDENKKRYFSCDIKDYKQGDEIVALQAIMDKKADDRAASSKLTAEQKDERTETARQTAEFLGLKELKGTAKQKSWAVTIRASVLEKLSGSIAETLLKIKYANLAKFWIENRYKKADDFEFFVNNFDKKKNDLYFLEKWKLLDMMSKAERKKFYNDNIGL